MTALAPHGLVNRIGVGKMLKEHDRVVLTEDLPGEGLEAGDVGFIVSIYRGGWRHVSVGA